MKLRFLLAALTVMTVATVSAKPITPDEALARLSVEKDVPSAIRSKLLKGSNATTGSNLLQGLHLDKTVTTSSNAAALYLYRSDNTMWILPADDSVTALLGYVDAPTDQCAMPEQLQWLLNEYAREIEYIRCHSDNVGTTSLRDESDSREPIAPLVTTTWDQREPYYNLCPVLDEQRCLTGCAATAVAQLLNYHQYPDRAEGQVTYTTSDDHTFAADLAEEAFDWDNMLDHYVAGEYTEQQAHAVAYLMMTCGYAMQMEYSPIESGTYDTSIYNALMNSLKINRNCKTLTRNNFTLSEWEDLFYKNLQVVGPLLVTGDDCVGGHAFICDGYSANGYFHFNWGWSGWYDGYFKLSALVPTGQGAGGNTGGFNFSQTATFNVTSPDKATIELPTFNPMLLVGNLTSEIGDDGVLYLSSDAIDYAQIMCYNSDATADTFYFGLSCTNTVTGDVQVVDLNQSEYCEQYDGLDDLEIANLSFGLAEGRYKAQLVTHTQESSDWQELRHTTYNNDYFYATIDSNGTLIAAENEATNFFTITNFSFPDKAYIDTKVKYSYSIANNSQYEIASGVRPAVFYVNDRQELQLLAYGDAVAYDMMPGEASDASLISTITIDDENIVETFLNEEQTPQAYIGLLSTDDESVLCYQAVTFGQAPETIMNGTIEYIGDANNVNTNELSFNCTVTCIKGYYTDTLTLFLVDQDGQMQHISSDEFYTLNADESVNVTMSHTFNDLTAGAYYTAYIGHIKGSVGSVFAETQIRMADDFNGIENVCANGGGISVNVDRTTNTITVSAPSDIVTIEAYAIDGRAYHLNAAINGATATASLNAIPNGVSIVKVTLKNGIGYSSKIMK